MQGFFVSFLIHSDVTGVALHAVDVMLKREGDGLTAGEAAKSCRHKYSSEKSGAETPDY
jgi:hypothetical protein